MTFGTPELLLAVLAGIGVGFLSGVFGLGGGFLIVPVLHVVLRIPMHLAVGAGACQVLGPATASILARRAKADQLRVPSIVAGGQLLGTILGAAALEWAQNAGRAGIPSVGQPVPLMDFLVLASYLALLTSIGLFALWEGGRNPGEAIGRGWMAGLPLPPYCLSGEPGERRLSIPLLSWFGLVVGFLAGMLGMSGGLLLLPGLVYLLGMSTQSAVRSTLIIVWIGAIPNTIVHAWHDNIDLWLVAALLVGGTVGARLGTEVGQRWAGAKLRKRFGWLLLATASMVAYRLAELFLG